MPTARKLAPKPTPEPIADDTIDLDIADDDDDEASPLTAAQAAEAIGTDARTLRKFLRSSGHFEAVGQGKRYAFSSDDVPSLARHFKDWARPKPPTPKAEADTSDIAEDDLLDLDELDDLA